MTPADAAHELSEPDQGAVLAGTPREGTTAELLELCDEFFRHPSPAVQAELRRFLAGRGYHPIAGAGWFTDALGFAALHQTGSHRT
jgi:hypothetical protein